MPESTGATTRITISPNRPIGQLDPNVFGGFIEHLGRCVYGGIYDEGSPLADGHGFRQDVLELLRELRVGVLRWPGGNFVSNYHWVDGIGPQDERPTRPELAWGGVESNRFGTDEYLRYCAELGTEPYICLNMGTGSLADALAWVEYCNSSADTSWARRRRANGRDEPYGVRYWALGNEMYGDWQIGALSAEEYVAEATRWARAIRVIDPRAKLVACGNHGWDDWDRVVIDGLAGLVDLYSVHIYTGSTDYWTNVLQPHQAERAISTASTLIRRTAYLHQIAEPPRLAYDEWNVWYREPGGALEERYDFADALAVATYLNIFVRNCDWVRMANLAQLVNAIAPIVTSAETAAVQPIYYPILLHAQAALGVAVDTYVAGPTVGADMLTGTSRWDHRIADLAPFTLVDASATVGARRDKVAVTMVNRSDETQRVELDLPGAGFGGPARVRTLTQERSPAGRVLPDVETAVLDEVTEKPYGSSLVLDLPARSFTVLEAPLVTS
ncbi:MAG TPA: alpha-L-arabinofuranosidase C-terminal domain-containing protein [Pseudonocardiaceae bacterium]|jgi:alpha-N-arabinofuranosidase|nr:alpha-L-arabinofuranosidase C-terminal domain-containing protein [Pseudonocardiaceae bacterium]